MVVRERSDPAKLHPKLLPTVRLVIGIWVGWVQVSFRFGG